MNVRAVPLGILAACLCAVLASCGGTNATESEFLTDKPQEKQR
jgi:hypothetical protein